MAEPRVLVVGLRWPPETFIANLLRGLTEHGLAVTVATADRPDDAWLRLPGFRWLRAAALNRPLVRRLSDFAVATPRALLRSPLRAARLAARVGRGPAWWRIWPHLAPFVTPRWDVVYAPWNSAAIAYLPLFEQRRIFARPTVVSCRGTQVNIAPHVPHHTGLRDGLRVTFSTATAVHCVCDAIRREAARWGLSPKKAMMIHPAVDTDFFHPAAAPVDDRAGDRELRVVSTGSLRWLKGHEHTLVALRALLDGGVSARLELIGDGPDRQRVLFTIRDLGLTGRVRLLGRQPPEAVRERLRDADAFVLSSVSEGISNAVLEAMACALPVVTTDCGGMTEAVTDGRDGLVVPVRAPAATARALTRLAGDPELRRRLGATARATVETRFALPVHVERFCELFRSVAHGSSPEG